MPKILLNPSRNKLSLDGLILYHDSLLNQPVLTTSNVTFNSVTCGDLTASGTIYLTGTITEVETQSFIVRDSFITLNDTNPQPLQSGGVKIIRGNSLPNYEIIYTEGDETLRIGTEGNVEPVATREENPSDGYVAIYQGSSKRFVTTNNITGPFTFSGTVNFLSQLLIGGSINSPYFVTNGSNDLILNSVGNILLNCASTIVPIGSSLIFNSNTLNQVFSEENGVLNFSGIQNFTTNSKISFNNNSLIYATNLGNDLNYSGTNLYLSPSQGLYISSPVIFGSFATGQVRPGNIFELSSIGNLQLTPGNSNFTFVKNLSLGVPGPYQINFVTSNVGDLAIDIPNNLTLNPTSYVLINSNKMLCFNSQSSSNIKFSNDLILTSSSGITLSGSSQVYIPGLIPLNIGTGTSLSENVSQNAVLSSMSSDILLLPGNLRAVKIPVNNALVFGTTEKIQSDGASMTIESQGPIKFTTQNYVNIPVLIFKDVGHIMYQDVSKNLVIQSNFGINISAVDNIQLSNTVNIGNTQLYQDTDGSLTLTSSFSNSYVKIPQDLFISSTTLATSIGNGSIKTLGGIFVGENQVTLGDCYIGGVLSVGQVITLSDSVTPITIQNSSSTNGTCLSFSGQWDTNSGYTIGRGTNQWAGGRSLYFSIPSYNIYGFGQRPSFSFGNNNGNVYVAINDILTQINSNVNCVGDGIFGGNVVSVSLATSNASVYFDTTTASVNCGLTVSSYLNINDVNNNSLLSISNVNLLCAVPAIFNASLAAHSVISLNGITAASGSFSGNIAMGGNFINNLANPINDLDAATKLYVDNVAIGRTDKQAVNAASTIALDLNSQIFNIDAVALSVGDRFLLKDQVNPIENGIYGLDQNSMGYRTDDFSIGMNVSGSSVFVMSGQVNGSVGFVVIGSNIIVGTSNVSWTPFSGAATINVSVGMEKIGNTLSVKVDNFSISVNNSNQLYVNGSSYFGTGFDTSNAQVQTSYNQSNVTMLGTINSGVWEGSSITVPYGGTGLSSVASGSLLFGGNSSSLSISTLLHYNESSNYFGIGTSTPTSELNLVNLPSTYQGTNILIEDTDSLVSQSSGITIQNITNSGSLLLDTTGAIILSQDSFSSQSKIIFNTQQQNRLILDSTGNMLLTQGDFTLNGSCIAKSSSIENSLSLFSTGIFTNDNLYTGVLLTTNQLRISGLLNVTGNCVIGNFTFNSLFNRSTILSNSGGTPISIYLRVTNNQSGISGICFNGGFVVPNRLQIGGVDTDSTTGFSFQLSGNDLTLTPGVNGSRLKIQSNIDFSQSFNFYSASAPSDIFTGQVSSGVLQLIGTGNTSGITFGGQGSSLIISFKNASGNGYVKYDATDGSGGKFIVSGLTTSLFGNEVKLNKELRFSGANGLSGVFGLSGNGWYYLGKLGIGRFSIGMANSFTLVITFDSSTVRIVSLIIESRSYGNLYIYQDNAGDYQLFLHIVNGPCHVTIFASPLELFYDYFEGSSGSPSGVYSTYSLSWTSIYETLTANPVGTISFDSLTTSGSASFNNATLLGTTIATGTFALTGTQINSGNSFIWNSSLYSSLMCDLVSNVNGNTLSITSPVSKSSSILLRDSGYISILSSTDSVYPNSLVISQSDQTTDSEIILKTQDIARLLVDCNGNVFLYSTTDSLGSNLGALNISGSVLVSTNLLVNGNITSSALNVKNGIGGNFSIICDISGNIDCQNTSITNVSDPINPMDVVNKRSLEAYVQGLSPKESVLVASVSSINLNSQLTVMDGISVSIGSRILLKDQSNPVENGIYTSEVLGPVRSVDFSIGSSVSGSFVFVEEGTTNGSSGWVVASIVGVDVIGVNTILFTQFSGAGEIIAGSGISKSGNILSVAPDNSSLELFNSVVRVSSGICGVGLSGGSGNPVYVSSITHLTELGTINLGTWNGSVISMDHGGTGVSSISNGKIVFSNGNNLTEGNLYFDAINVRLGINTVTPISGLTVSDRDINIYSQSSVCYNLFTDSVYNYTFGLRNEAESFIISGGSGNNKLTLTDLVVINENNGLTSNFGLTSNMLSLNNVTFTDSQIFNVSNGPLNFDLFSNDNSGTFLRFFGLGSHNNTADSEYLKIGNISGNYTIATGFSGTGLTKKLILQTGFNVNQLVLNTDSSVSINGSLSVSGSIMSSGIGTFIDLFTTNLTVSSLSTSDNLILSGQLSLGGYNINDNNGTLLLSNVTSGSAANIFYFSMDSNNSVDTKITIFGFGKDKISNSEWCDLGYDNSLNSYIFKTNSIGTGIARSINLSTGSNVNQLQINGNNTVNINSTVNVSGAMTVANTIDAVNFSNGGALSVLGGLAVAMSAYFGTFVNIPILKLSNRIEYTNSYSLDQVFSEYSGNGVLDFYNNSNLSIVIHVGNSSGPNTVNQEYVSLGYKDLNTVSLTSSGTGSGNLRDIAIETKFFSNQILLSASTGQVSINGNLYVSDMTNGSNIGGSIFTLGGGSFAKSVYVGNLITGSGIAGNILQLNTIGNNWTFGSILTGLTLSPQTDSLFQIMNASQSTVLLSLNTLLNNVEMDCTVLVSVTDSRAFVLQTATNSDSFVFDTLNHKINMFGGTIVNLALPQNPLDAVNKLYVDSLAAGLQTKQSVNVASVANVNTLSPLTIIDGYTLNVDDRILLKNQTNAVENGIYVFLNSGYIVRSSDLASGSLAAGTYVYVQSGTNSHNGYVCISVNSVTGQNPILFTQFNAATSVFAGNGLENDGGNSFSIYLDNNSGLSFNVGALRIDPTFAGNGLTLNLGVLSVNNITTLGTITTGVWNGSVISLPFGGTNSSSFSNAELVFSDGTSLLSTSGLFYNSTTHTLGINVNNSDSSNGLSINDKDLNLVSTTIPESSIVFSDNIGNYYWRLRKEAGLSDKSTLPIANSVYIRMSYNGTTGFIITEPGETNYITTSSGSNWYSVPFFDTIAVSSEIAISQTGTYILVPTEADYLYLSQDNGTTFNAYVTDFVRLWEWVSMSQSGQYMMASSLSDGMFVSVDSGSTWTYALDTDTIDIGFVYVSNSGSVMFAGYTPGNVMISTDHGTTWNNQGIRTGEWYDIKEAASSSYLVLWEYPGSIWVSNNLGTTFTEKMNDTARDWISCSISGNGSIIVGAVSGGLIYISTDYGSSFSSTYDNTNRIWTFISITSTGSQIFAGGQNIPVITSINTRSTWTTLNSNLNVQSASLASGNNSLFYPVYGGKVYSYNTSSSTNLIWSTGNSTTKSGLSDYLVFTDSGQVGIGFNSSSSANISATLDINGTLNVSENVYFGQPLGVSSGGSGASNLTGVLIGNGSSRYTASGSLSSGTVMIGNSDNSGTIAYESGSTLRSHLGLAIGSDIQGYSSVLTNLSSLSSIAGNFIIGSGSSFATYSVSSVQTLLGLQSLAYRNTIDNSYFSGTQLSVIHGGTGTTSFTTNVLPYFNGTSLSNSIIFSDITNSAICVGQSSTILGAKFTVSGDVAVQTTNNASASSFIFGNSNGDASWRIRRQPDPITSANSSLVISGGVPNSILSSLTDNLSISSTGIVYVLSTTDTSSVSTGCIVLSGGMGISGGIYSSGINTISNTTDSSGIGTGSLIVSGGASISKKLYVVGTSNFTNTANSLSFGGASVNISGGLTMQNTLFTQGQIVIQKGTVAGSKATGLTISADTSSFSSGSTISDSNRHLSLINSVSTGSVVLSLRNTTASYGWDIALDGSGNNKLNFQTNGTSVTNYMSLDAATGTLTLNSTNDSTSTTSSSLVVLGGIYVSKSITAIGIINAGISSTVTNTSGVSQFKLTSDVGNASLFLNNSTTNADGTYNSLTLRNSVGILRLQSNTSQGITINSSGVVSTDNTTDATSSSVASVIVNGGLGVVKSAYIGSNLTVSGTFSAPTMTSSPTVTLSGADLSNVSTISVYSSYLTTINSINTLVVNVQVTPTSSSTVTLFSVSLPNKASNLTNRMDVTGAASCYSDSVNLNQVTALCTGIASSQKAIVKFTSNATTVHYVQITIVYTSS